MPRRKNSHSKKYAGAALAVIIIMLITAAVFYYNFNTKQAPTSTPNSSEPNTPLAVGDTFTY